MSGKTTHTPKTTHKHPVESEHDTEADTKPVFAEIYRKLTLEETVRLTPEELDGNINEVCLYHLKRKVGNKCTKEGYIDGRTISIIQRTIGRMNTKFLDGSVNYKIIFSADVCHPKKGDILPVTFVDMNHAGILAQIKGAPLNIVLSKNLHGAKEQEIYARLDKNDSEEQNKILAIEIIGTQNKQNTASILVIGKLVGILD